MMSGDLSSTSYSDCSVALIENDSENENNDHDQRNKDVNAEEGWFPCFARYTFASNTWIGILLRIGVGVFETFVILSCVTASVNFEDELNNEMKYTPAE